MEPIEVFDLFRELLNLKKYAQNLDHAIEAMLDLMDPNRLSGDWLPGESPSPIFGGRYLRDNPEAKMRDVLKFAKIGSPGTVYKMQSPVVVAWCDKIALRKKGRPGGREVQMPKGVEQFIADTVDADGRSELIYELIKDQRRDMRSDTVRAREEYASGD